MQPFSGPGLVLRRNRHQEQDLRLVVLLREHGKFLILSRGGLKFSTKLKALQEPFTEADFHLSGTAHGLNARLIGGKLIRSSHPLSGNLEAFTMASRCTEVVDSALPYRAPSPEVFDILRGTFQTLSLGENPDHIWLDFCLNILRCLGYGDVSSDLMRLLPASERAVDSARPHWSSLSPASLRRCQSFLEPRLEQILPRPLKSAVLIES